MKIIKKTRFWSSSFGLIPNAASYFAIASSYFFWFWSACPSLSKQVRLPFSHCPQLKCVSERSRVKKVPLYYQNTQKFVVLAVPVGAAIPLSSLGAQVQGEFHCYSKCVFGEHYKSEKFPRSRVELLLVSECPLDVSTNSQLRVGDPGVLVEQEWG